MNPTTAQPDDLKPALDRILALVSEELRPTPLTRLTDGLSVVLGGGKMLRARLALRIGAALGVAEDLAARVGAAVELVHAASLLHDDVIDGGELRRGLPAFWRTYGVRGAILAGDLLLCKAYDLVRIPFAPASCSLALVDLTREMCETEIEQELLLRGVAATHEDALRLARGKTGSLFAFAACGAATEPALADALREAGYLAGTAYQLSDDILDVAGDVSLSGKSLGTDAERGKITAVTVNTRDTEWALTWIDRAAADSATRLAAWPDVQAAWTRCWSAELAPAMERNLSGMRERLAAVP